MKSPTPDLIERLIHTPCDDNARRSAAKRGIRRHRQGDVIIITHSSSERRHGRHH